MIAIVDSALGNLASVRNALRAVGAEPVLTSDPAILGQADGIVLPGQGAAPTGMRRLREHELDGVLRQLAREGRPILGICLGMQLLFEHSDEGDVDCLGLLPGEVRLLRGDVKLPQIGWNQVVRRGTVEMWDGLADDPYFYFVHSYVCVPHDERDVAGTTEYGETFCSVIARGSIWGTQFHPERSGMAGLRLIKNFVRRCEARAGVDRIAAWPGG